MSMSKYEQALVFATKNGNEKSFEELYKIYYQKVFLLAKATLKNEADAEDVLQQTFISAWNNISTLEDNSAFNTWIQRITLNQCYSLLRKSKPAISIDDENENGGVFELESDLLLPEVYAQQEDLKVRLGNIIAQLSDVQGQTIQLFYFDEMTVEEIANVMDCSVGTVKSRLFLARKAIRTELEENERKTGSKFYGVAGIPVLEFGKLFSSQVEAASIQVSSAISAYSKITAKLFGTAKDIVIETAQEIAREVENVAAETAQNEVAKSVAEKQTKAVVKDSIKKVTSSVAKNISSRIIAAVVSGGILCGSVFGSFSTVSAAKVTMPANSDEINYMPAYSAYITLLNKEQEYIDAYTWQKGHFGSDDYWNNDEPKPVVLADVYGDDIPELIYITKNEEYTADSALHIVTYKNASMVELYNEEWDHVAGGGFSYYLFQNNEDKSLNAYTSTGDEAWTIAYSRFVEENGKLVKKDYLKYYTYPDQESIANGNYRKIDEYTSDGKKIDKSKYESQERKIIDKTKSVLMYSSGIPERISENIDAFITKNGCFAITCSEAVLYLKTKIGQPFTLQANEVPASLTRFFYQFDFGWGYDKSYDSTKPSSDYFKAENSDSSNIDNVLYRIMTNGSCCDSFIYPGKAPVIHDCDGTKDPKNKFGESYLEYDLEKAKWIAKNILNQSESNIDDFVKQGENNGYFYVQNGKAYLQYGGVGGPGHLIDYISASYDGKKLHISYSDSIEYDEEYSTSYEATVEYKEIDGSCYWSLYNLKCQVNTGLNQNLDIADVNINNIFDYLQNLSFTHLQNYKITFDKEGNIYYDNTEPPLRDGYIYYCKFKAHCNNVIKYNDFIYKIEINDIQLENEPGDFRDDGDGTFSVAEEPYSFKNGTHILVYLPGTNVSYISNKFLESATYQTSYSNGDLNIDFWGICIETSNFGFYSINNQAKESTAISNQVTTMPVSFNDKTLNLQWGWNLFNKDASEYDHNIAMAGLVLSQASELGQDKITSSLATLGFENFASYHYETLGFWDILEGLPAVTFASHKINLNGAEKILVAVVVRGSSDLGDWLTDLQFIPYGFAAATNNTQKAFKEFYNDLSNFYKMNISSKNTILFITGHSLGGAVAGGLGASLKSDGYANDSSIFDYTFASPNYFTDNDKVYKNIHNIVNKNDIVPNAPLGYGKNGHCWYYDSDDNGGIIQNHICKTYMDCMLKDVPSNIGKGAKSTYSLSSIHCPVDIQILDKNGNIAAWTSGENVYYAKEANLLILIDKDEKYVYAPEGIEYNILFTGTDNGTMNYTQQIILNDKVVSEKNFENISIETGKLFYASVNIENASTQALKVIDNSGHIQKEVKESGKESTPFLSLSIIGWVFLCLNAISGISLIISILAIIKKRQNTKVIN